MLGPPMTVNLVKLRSAKNAVIGNPSAKLQLARDPSFVTNLVDCLSYPGERAQVRIEAAHIVASLSYGSDEALLALLRAHAPHALVYALARFTPDDVPPLRAAFARALRALATSVADALGPSQWGLGPTPSLAQHEDIRGALEFLFQPESLDTFLPFLSDTTTQVSTSIAQLLASAIRTQKHRFCVSEWLPPAERIKTKDKDSRPRTRGWEKTPVGPGPARLGGWTVRELVGSLASRDLKLQEAALGALAALAKDSTNVATALARQSTDREVSPLTAILNLAKSRSPDVQLAACLCAAHVLRALPRHQQDDSSTRIVMDTVNRMIASPFSPAEDIATPHAYTDTTLGNLGQVTLAQRTRACFVLYHLVIDDTSLCQAAYDRGCLAHLVGLVTALPLPPTPPSMLAEAELLVPGSGNGTAGTAASLGGSRVYIPPPEGETKTEDEEEWCEPDGRALLREAALTAIAAISLFDNDVRRSLTEPIHHPSYHQPSLFYSTSTTTSASASHTHTPSASNSPFSLPLSPSPSPPAPSSSTPPLLPVLLAGLAHPSPGVRYAACQCVRAMSRAVGVVKTNIVDSGLGVSVWRRCVKRRGRGVGQGRSGGGSESLDSGDTGGDVEGDVRGEEDKRVIGAGLMVVCNLVIEFSPLTSVLLEDGLLESLVEILGDDETSLRYNALWAIKNLLHRSSSELKRRVMKEIGWTRLLGFLEDNDPRIREQALNVLRNVTEREEDVELVYREVSEDVLLDNVASALKSSNDDIVLQAAYLLANLTNDMAHHARIIYHPKILPALHEALVASTISPSSPSTAQTPHAHTHTQRAHARGPLVSCVAQLAVTSVEKVRAAGFEGALRHVCEWGGGGLGGGRGPVRVWDDDRHVVERARQALRLIERGGSRE